jgi:ACS family D-galactonate transporter-like MFS transporter
MASREEVEYIEAGGGRDAEPEKGHSSGGIRWVDLLRYRTIWGIMIGFFCQNFVSYFFITWFPSYLVQARGFSLFKLGIFGTIPALAAIVGGLLGGYFSGYLVHRGVGLTWARKIPLVGGLLLSSVVALAAVVPDAALALTLLAIANGFLTFGGANVWSLPGDIAPTPNHVASIAGIQNFASNLSGILITAFVGVMLTTTGSYVIPLIVTGGVAIVGGLSYLIILGKIEPLPPLTKATAVEQ